MSEKSHITRAVAPDLRCTAPTAAAPALLPPSPPDPDVFAAIKVLFDRVHVRLDKLEQRRNARRGVDGIGIQDVVVDGAGDLIVTFSDGYVKNCGRVRGADAPPAPPPQQLTLERDDGKVVRAVLS